MANLPSNTSIGRFRAHLRSLAIANARRTEEVEAAIGVLDEAMQVVNGKRDGTAVGDATSVADLLEIVGLTVHDGDWPQSRFGAVLSLHSLAEHHLGKRVGNRLTEHSGGRRRRATVDDRMPSAEMLEAVNTTPPTSRALLVFANERGNPVVPRHIALVFCEPHLRGRLGDTVSPESIRDVPLDPIALTTELMAYERADRKNGPGIVRNVLAELRMFQEVKHHPERSLSALDTTVGPPRLTGDQIDLGDVYGFLGRVHDRKAITRFAFLAVSQQVSKMIGEGATFEVGLAGAIDFLDSRVRKVGAPPHGYKLLSEALGTMALQWPAQFPAAFQDGVLRPSLANAIEQGEVFAPFVTTEVNGRTGVKDTEDHFAAVAREPRM